jgi:iron complex transport system substrate-binding protein
MKYFFYQSLICFLFFSCTGKQSKSDSTSERCINTEVHHAKGFSIKRFSNYTLVELRNPWDTSQIYEKYILINRKNKVPNNLPEGTLVRTPVERVATCSSIFAGEYYKLGDIDKIVALSEPEYVDIPIIKTGLKNGRIIDLGRTPSLNVEKLLASRVDILIISPFEDATHDALKSKGIVLVKDASYMENTPLGRTEWLKLEAAFLEKDLLADQIFSAIEKQYMDLCRMANECKTKPTVFSEKKTGDSWFIPGGDSYMGNFMKDAGANYIWKDLKQTGSVPYTFEKVYSEAIDADFWLIKYNNTQVDMSYKGLQDEYSLYQNFSAFKHKHIYAVNSGKSPFYEEGPMEPNVILSDLIYIFHPNLLPNYIPKYYKKIN